MKIKKKTMRKFSSEKEIYKGIEWRRTSLDKRRKEIWRNDRFEMSRRMCNI